MASVIRQAWRIARKVHHCHHCGYVISPGQEYQDIAFRTAAGMVFAKVSRVCAPNTMHPYSDCEYDVERAPPAPWGTPLDAVTVSRETIDLLPGQRTFRSAHDGRTYLVPDFEQERLRRLLKGEAP